MVDLARKVRSELLTRRSRRTLYVTSEKWQTPTPEKVLNGIERSIGAKLPAPVRALYRATQEFGLAWEEGTTASTPYDKPVPWKALAGLMDGFWSKVDRNPAARGGVIAIPKATEVFRKNYWIDRLFIVEGETLELDGKEIKDSVFFGDLYPFDFFNHSYTAALWHHGGRWRVVLGDDAGACWTNYKTLGVVEYFGQLAGTLGLTRTFEEASSRRKERIFALVPEPRTTDIAAEEVRAETCGVFRRFELPKKRRFCRVKLVGTRVLEERGEIGKAPGGSSETGYPDEDSAKRGYQELIAGKRLEGYVEIAQAQEVVAPEAGPEVRAWWSGLPPEMQSALIEAADIPSAASDRDLGLVLQIKALQLKKPEFDSVEPFLPLRDLEALTFAGDPDSIEPLRALPKLEVLTIGRTYIHAFAWPSRAQRDLWKALATRNLDEVDAAIARGASLSARDSDGWGPLALACIGADGSTVRLFEFCRALVERGADPWATRYGYSHPGDLFRMPQCADPERFYFDESERQALAETATRAGVVHPDESPWRTLEATGGTRFERPDFVADLKTKCWAKRWPGPSKARYRMESEGELHDFCRGNIVSERLAQALEGNPDIELLPISILDPRGKPRKGRYFLLRSTRSVDCLVLDSCFPKWRRFLGEAPFVEDVAAFVIDPSKVEGRRLFTISNTGDFSPFIVTRALAAELSGMTNLSCGHLKR